MRVYCDKKIHIGRLAREVQEALGSQELPHCAYNEDEKWVEVEEEISKEKLEEVAAVHGTVEKDPYHWPEWKVKLHKIGKKQLKEGKKLTATEATEYDSLMKQAVFQWLENERGEQ